LPFFSIRISNFGSIPRKTIRLAPSRRKPQMALAGRRLRGKRGFLWGSADRFGLLPAPPAT